MISFIDDDGNELLFDGDFAITKQAISFFNGKIKGDVSVTFSLDNNSVNRRILEYDGPNTGYNQGQAKGETQLSFPGVTSRIVKQLALVRKVFTRYRNGNVLDRGYIVIQKETSETLNCFYVSGNSNWLQSLEGLITELDYTGLTNGRNYELQLTASVVSSNMSATSGVVFPFIDWVYKGRKGNNEWFMARLMDAQADTMTAFMEFYPCFYLHSLMAEIANQNGLKFAGNILDDKLYNTLVITPDNGQMARDDIKITTAMGTLQTVTTTESTYTLNETNDPEGAFASSRYTAIRNSRMIITLNIITSNATASQRIRIKLRKNGTALLTLDSEFAGNKEGSYMIDTTAMTADVFDVTVQIYAPFTGTSTILMSIKFDIPTVIIQNDFVTPSNFLPSLTCLDIVRFVVNYFGCVAYYNEYSKTISINILENLKREDAEDWSAYYISHSSDYTIESARNNYLRLADGDETSINSYNRGHTVRYGEGNITTDNTLKDNNELTVIPFGASEFSLNQNGNWQTNISLVDLADSGEGFEFTSIKTDSGGTGLAEYLFPTDAAPGDTPALFVRGQVLRIVDYTKGDIGYYIVHTYRENASTDSTKSTLVFWGIPFDETSTGRLYPQAFSYRQTKPRLLVVRPDYSFSNITTIDSSYNIYDDSYSATSKTTTALGYFSKSRTTLGIDGLRANVAFDNPDIVGFNDPTVKEMYFNKIGNVLNSPIIPAMLLLPEAVYQSYSFDRFVYLKTEKLTGYFFVKQIGNYVDGNTPVEVELYLI